jgi:orotidine-5'-phosphate decarboxylase
MTPPSPHDRVFCALDTTDVATACDLAERLKSSVGGIKLGLEFFCANGADGFRRVAEMGLPIFLDLKFHDIPNTVAGAIRAVAPLAPQILTIHTQGGAEMMRRAAETAAEEADKHGLAKPLVVGVTILTSLDASDLQQMAVANPPEVQVPLLAQLAHENGLDGIVCSPKEIGLVRARVPLDFKLVVPGIRPIGSAVGDQKRVMTPKDAVEAGADVLVIGRPITTASDPAVAARAIAESL